MRAAFASANNFGTDFVFARSTQQSAINIIALYSYTSTVESQATFPLQRPLGRNVRLAPVERPLGRICRRCMQSQVSRSRCNRRGPAQRRPTTKDRDLHRLQPLIGQFFISTIFASQLRAETSLAPKFELARRLPELS